MICRNCGNVVADGVRFCDKCGAPIENVGQFGRFAPKGMSKKEYFDSNFCSSKANQNINKIWVLFAVLTVCVIFSTAMSVVRGLSFLDVLDYGIDDIRGVVTELENLSDESFYIDEETWGIFEKSLEYVNIPFLVKAVVYCIVVFKIVSCVLSVLFALLTVLKKNNVFAVVTLVFAFLFGLGLVPIAMAVWMLVITLDLNKEYDNYLSYSRVDSTGANTPTFGA